MKRSIRTGIIAGFVILFSVLCAFLIVTFVHTINARNTFENKLNTTITNDNNIIAALNIQVTKLTDSLHIAQAQEQALINQLKGLNQTPVVGASSIPAVPNFVLPTITVTPPKTASSPQSPTPTAPSAIVKSTSPPPTATIKRASPPTTTTTTQPPLISTPSVSIPSIRIPTIRIPVP